jgi:hypothetical protein
MKEITISLSNENLDNLKKGSTIIIFGEDYRIIVEKD